MKSITVLLILGSLFLLGKATCQEKFRLEYKYVKGETLKYQEDSKFDNVTEINGEEMKSTGSTISLMKIRVDSISENGDITLVNSLEDYKFHSKMFNRDTTLIMTNLLNRDIRTVISKRGKMIENKLLDTIGSGKDITDKGNSLFNIFKEITTFPDQELKFGDTWTDDRTDTTQGTQMVTRTNLVYTLLGIEVKNGHTCFKAGFAARTEIGGKMTQMGMEFFIEGTGDISGNVWFDKETCTIISKESVNDQDMTMALTGQMQMTIPTTTTSSSKLTLIE
jgi:hypothetical protein